MNTLLEIDAPIDVVDGLDQLVRARAAIPIAGWRIERRSLDARRGRVIFKLQIRVWDRDSIPEPLMIEPGFSRPTRKGPPVVVVGAGPAGLFASLALASRGVPVTLLDQGEAFPSRHLRVRDLRLKGEFHQDSNIRFGLGGAGTYSDGKLFTRKRTPEIREVLGLLAWFCRNESLAVDARPHVGSNRLIPMLARFLEWLTEAGVELRFSSRMESLVRTGTRITGVMLDGGEVLPAAAVILAPGNSARRTFQALAQDGVRLEARPFAVGVRVEHPRKLIDRIQLRSLADHPALAAAEYRLTHQYKDRGVYTFCMCPGGQVLPTPTQEGHLAVNGASFSTRSSAYSNAAMVVTVGPGDWNRIPGPLAGMEFQQKLERAAFAAGGGGYRAPAQALLDFVARRSPGPTLPGSSYLPGLVPTDLRALLPAAVSEALVAGFRAADERMRGYLSEEALLIGVETTTSSPVRIVRNDQGVAEGNEGLYPCGEGAGYGGGITSSAADGLFIGRSVAASLGRDGS